MDLNKLEQDIKSLVTSLNQDEFIYDLLLAYDFPKSSITRLKKGDYNKSIVDGETLWKKNLFFKIETQGDLHLTIDEAQKDSAVLKQNPRFIIATDFNAFLAVDTKTGDSLDITLDELGENTTFFLPWAGMEKTQIESLQLADRKAAESLAQLYDIIIHENQIETEQERHGLNTFLSRLLFCFFAEDTGIFEDDQFTNAIASHTNDDGSDLQDYLIALFKVMNVEKRTTEPQHVKDFPYVNGGLFAEYFPAPKLNAKARKMIIDAGTLNWKQINPDIFGSMIQAVVRSDVEGDNTEHYTSVPNILKVIEPLFLNDLKEQLENADGNENKLTKLLDRLYHLRLFDPACGSGNFLIIAYKELCKLEIEIFKQLQQVSGKWKLARSGVLLTQFYGIELNDFAHETAKLSLWLAEHQMNSAFKEVFGEAKPTLPLQEGGHVVCDNAARLDWEEVCPKEEAAEIYILGNPPFVGTRNQTKEQKEDIDFVFKRFSKRRKLDYIAIWFKKGSDYIEGCNCALAFVSTNSICQGEQVPILWPLILENDKEVNFAHQTFKWSNNAKNNAGVSVVIIGLSQATKKVKHLYIDNLFRSVNNINPFLAAAPTVYIQARSRPLSSLPNMVRGNYTGCCNELILTNVEKNNLINESADAGQFIRRLVGSSELISGNTRYCLWIPDEALNKAKKIIKISDRINKVKLARLKSSDKGQQRIASRSHQFREFNETKNISLVIPVVSSERRKFIPCSFVNSEVIVPNSAQVIYDTESWVFSVLMSTIHNVWVGALAGRLRSDIRYSSSLCYNTFPFPEISEDKKMTLEDHVFKILDEREQHSEKTMAELYNPDKMPEGLRLAHHEMDLAVEQCYRKKPFKSDEERLEYLFKLYEEMIEAEARI